MATSLTDVGRLERERVFHDDRYRDESRSAQDKFYVGLSESDDFFRAKVDSFEPGQRVLELGCGIESLGFEAAARGVEVVGVDISSVAVSQASSTANELGLDLATYVEMNAEDLEFDDSTFDGVIGTAVLHHLDVDKACGGMARVLRPGGRAVFIEPLGHNRLINAYRDRTPEARTPDEHPLRRRDFATAARHFEQVELDAFHLLSALSGPLSNHPTGRWIHRAMTQVDQALLGRRGLLRWQAWIAVAEFRNPRLDRR